LQIILSFIIIWYQFYTCKNEWKLGKSSYIDLFSSTFFLIIYEQWCNRLEEFFLFVHSFARSFLFYYYCYYIYISSNFFSCLHQASSFCFCSVLSSRSRTYTHTHTYRSFFFFFTFFFFIWLNFHFSSYIMSPSSTLQFKVRSGLFLRKCVFEQQLRWEKKDCVFHRRHEKRTKTKKPENVLFWKKILEVISDLTPQWTSSSKCSRFLYWVQPWIESSLSLSFLTCIYIHQVKEDDSIASSTFDYFR